MREAEECLSCDMLIEENKRLWEELDRLLSAIEDLNAKGKDYDSIEPSDMPEMRGPTVFDPSA
jgi:hypothetical protein